MLAQEVEKRIEERPPILSPQEEMAELQCKVAKLEEEVGELRKGKENGRVAGPI